MPTSKPVVLRLGRLLFAHDSWEKLAEIADIVTIPEETIIEELIRRFSDPNDILSQVKVITRSADSVGQTGRFDKDIAAAVPDSLVAVCHTGVGYDQIDVKYFSERHIQVSNTPDVVTDATADTHVFLLLERCVILGPVFAIFWNIETVFLQGWLPSLDMTPRARQ